jgi:hypothetical protein
VKYPRLTRLRRLPGELVGKRYLQSDAHLWRALEPVLARSSSKGCTFFELAHIHRHVIKRRPARILELGSGISTIVLASAATRIRTEGGVCFVVSMEQHDSWFNEIRQLVPPELAQSIELILSPIEDRKIGRRIAGCYSMKPKQAYDFVFIDGPQHPLRNDPAYFDGDLLDAIDWNPNAFTACLDGRTGTLANLRQILPWAGITHNPNHKFTHIEIPSVSARTPPQPL